MSFASQAREEIARRSLQKDCCVRAAAYGIACFAKYFDASGLVLQTEQELTTQVASQLFARCGVQGNIIDDKAVQDEVKYEYYDIAVANILADVIIMLQKEIPVHIKKNGIFITSGIIDMKEEAVKAAFEANDAFEIVEITHQGEWVSVTARKK